MIKRRQTDKEIVMEEIIIVSGLPRSGTSMMMNLLSLGGIDIIKDDIREPDINNPKGYFEYEQIKNLPEGDNKWLFDMKGKCLKIISHFLLFLPDDHKYKVVFMERDLDEVLKSQERMMGLKDSGNDVVEMKNIFLKHLHHIKLFLSKNTNFDVLFINYKDVLNSPIQELKKIEKFLSSDFDINKMAKGIDKSLYRNKV